MYKCKYDSLVSDAGRVWAAVGAHKDADWHTRFGVKTVLIHPLHASITSFDHDFALLELNGTAEINDNVRPVCAPSADVDVGWKAVTTGWGNGKWHLYTLVMCM